MKSGFLVGAADDSLGSPYVARSTTRFRRHGYTIDGAIQTDAAINSSEETISVTLGERP
jgi:hypothetical protein